MPIYLKDVLADPGILTRSPPDRKSRAQFAEEREDAMYEALGAEIEARPLGRVEPKGDKLP